MEISKVTYTTRQGDRYCLIPTDDPDLVENIFGGQKNRIVAIDPLNATESSFISLTTSEPSQKEVTDLFQALGQLFTLGVDPVGSLNILIRRVKNIKLSKRLLDISSAIQQGEPIAEAFGMFSQLFGETAIQLIRAGSATGNLGQAFDNLAINMTKARTVAGKVQSALMYPVAVLCVVYLVLMIFAFGVIPKLAEVYESFGADLPFLTRILQKFSEILQQYPFLAGAGPVFGFILFQLREKLGRSAAFNVMLRHLPGIKNFIWKKNLTQACSTLALLLDSGLPLTDSLAFASNVVSDPHLSRIFIDIRDRLEDGELVNEAFSEYVDDLGPDGPRLVLAVEVGDATGSLAPLIKKLAVAMEEEFDRSAENLNRLLEPIVILILTTIVGLIVYAIYFPIFTMGQQMMKK